MTAPAGASVPILEASGLVKHYPARGAGPAQAAARRGPDGAIVNAGGGSRWRRLFGPRAVVRALDGVDLSVTPGECLAVVGESGSGKTTLARTLLRLVEPTAGEVRFEGEDLLALAPEELRRRRRRFQMVFQDPYSSLNPRLTVGRTLAEPLEAHRLLPRERWRDRVARQLEEVGLPAETAERHPHQLSGGQRQRVAVARALISEPQLVVADEPVSALDVSVQAQIINLLIEARRRRGLTLLLIAHDLALVEQVADRVAVMYLGKIVEIAPRRRLFRQPRHPYTAGLLAAVPAIAAGRPVGPEGNASGDEEIPLRWRAVAGEPPSPLAPPPGCSFHPRCPIARPRCAAEEPPLRPQPPFDGGEGEQRSACHFAEELAPEGAAR